MSLTKVSTALIKGAPLTPYDFGAVGDGVADDTAAMQAWVAYLNAADGNVGSLAVGTFTFNQTLVLTRRERAIVGPLAASGERTGTPATHGVVLKWTGADTDPMFQTAVARHKFAHFDIECSTSAKNFIRLDAGAQALRMDDISFASASFTEATIYADGPRLGYSIFSNLLMAKAAPYFIKMVSTGTQGVTPINFEYCEFKNGVASGGVGGGEDPYTIFYSENTTSEALRFWRCTFISRRGVTIADTRTNAPAGGAIRTFVLDECELDNYGDNAGTFRAGYLTGVDNICMNNNLITGEPTTPTHLFDLVSSNVVSFYGNMMNGLGYVFSADSASNIRGVGANFADWSSVEGITDATDNWYIDVTQANRASLDSVTFSPSTTAHYICDVTTDTAYGFNLDTSRPQNWEAGQLFYITIKNVSGGAVAANATFGTAFNVQAAAVTTPANGQQISILFRYDGTKAMQIGQISPAIANS